MQRTESKKKNAVRAFSPLSECLGAWDRLLKIEHGSLGTRLGLCTWSLNPAWGPSLLTSFVLAWPGTLCTHSLILPSNFKGPDEVDRALDENRP